MAAVRFKIHTVQTDNGIHFTNPKRGARSPDPSHDPPEEHARGAVPGPRVEFTCAPAGT